MYINSYLTDSVVTTKGNVQQTSNKVTTTQSGTTSGNVSNTGMKVGTAFKLAKKDDGMKQAVEVKPKDSSVYNVSTREKDIVRYTPEVITDTVAKKSGSNELIPGVPNYVVYGGAGLLALLLIYSLTGKK